MAPNLIWKKKDLDIPNYKLTNFRMLKQTANETRTLFLKLFTKEIILNSKPKIESGKEIKEVEKQKIEEVETGVIKEEKKAVEINELAKPIELKKTETIVKEKPIPSILKIERPRPVGPLRPITLPLESLKKYSPTIPSTMEPSKFTMPISTLPKIEGEINLGKLNIFLLDNEVTELECPGPDKFILVRKAGQVNLTKITLSQEEINEIIKSFSEKARIPVISGVFKTSIGNLTITAIISEFVGSRFIIYKSNPYAILEQQARQIRQAQLQGKLLYSRGKEIPRF